MYKLIIYKKKYKFLFFSSKKDILFCEFYYFWKYIYIYFEVKRIENCEGERNIDSECYFV